MNIEKVLIIYPIDAMAGIRPANDLLVVINHKLASAPMCVLPVSFPVHTTMAVINPTERKMAKRTSVHCHLLFRRELEVGE